MSPIPQRYNLKAIHNFSRLSNSAIAVSPIPQRYNLKAIHNQLITHLWDFFGVTNTSKIQSESNSQLANCSLTLNPWCHQYLKDTIWKQFTTINAADIKKYTVSPIPQRYNLKAIHNTLYIFSSPLFGVTNTSKIQSESNSQQAVQLASRWCGVTNTSKIQSESNSQLNLHKCRNEQGCHQYLKDTIWKQFTTYNKVFCGLKKVSPIPQRYNLKAIHNKLFPCQRPIKVSPIPQRYNLKAIHNQVDLLLCFKQGVTNTSKIQSESNSQLFSLFMYKYIRCHQYLKDTIWKQFTTQ